MPMPSKLIFFIICSALILTTLLYGTVHQPILALFYLSASLIVFLWATEGFVTGKLRYSTSLLQIPLIATILYGIFQIIPFSYIPEVAGVNDIPKTISIDPFSTKLAIVHFITLSIYFAAILTFIDSVKRIKKLVFLMIIFGAIYSFYAILQSILSPQKIYGIYELPVGANPFGSFVNRNNFAALIEMIIALPLGMLFTGVVPKDKRLLYGIAIGLMGVALLLSGSRGGLIAFLAEILFLIFFAIESKGTKGIILKTATAVLFLIIMITGAAFVGSETTLTRIAQERSELGEPVETTNRLHIWSVSLKIIANNPIFGVGLGAFPQAYTQFDTLSGAERVEQAHNDYLQVLTDAGIFGLIFAGFFVVYLFKKGFESIKTDNEFRRAIAVGSTAGCFAILVHSFFDFVLHVTAISLFFLTLCSLVVLCGQPFPDDEIKKHKRRRKHSTAEPEQQATTQYK
jgi:O-antigen ligase